MSFHLIVWSLETAGFYYDDYETAIDLYHYQFWHQPHRDTYLYSVLIQYYIHRQKYRHFLQGLIETFANPFHCLCVAEY